MLKMLPGLCAGLFVVLIAAAWLVSPGLAGPGLRSVPAELRSAGPTAGCGKASWYGPGFHGRSTASGVPFNQHAMTAAHKTLPFGTKLRVSYRGRAVTVTVNDRGPYIRGRALDLSKGAAQRLGLIPAGVGEVCWQQVR